HSKRGALDALPFKLPGPSNRLSFRGELWHTRLIEGETGSVEVAEKILPARAAGTPVPVEIHLQNPASFPRHALYRQLEKIGALPGSADGALGAKITQFAPLLQIVGSIKTHFSLGGQSNDHSP